MNQNVTNLIERLEVFEERAGVRLEALGASASEGNHTYQLTVLAEIHARDGMKIEKDVLVTISLYDKSGSIVQIAREYLSADRFFGFESIQLSLYDVPPPKTWAKISVVPRQR